MITMGESIHQIWVKVCTENVTLLKNPKKPAFNTFKRTHVHQTYLDHENQENIAFLKNIHQQKKKKMFVITGLDIHMHYEYCDAHVIYRFFLNLKIDFFSRR